MHSVSVTWFTLCGGLQISHTAMWPHNNIPQWRSFFDSLLWSYLSTGGLSLNVRGGGGGGSAFLEDRKALMHTWTAGSCLTLFAWHTHILPQDHHLNSPPAFLMKESHGFYKTQFSPAFFNPFNASLTNVCLFFFLGNDVCMLMLVLLNSVDMYPLTICLQCINGGGVGVVYDRWQVKLYIMSFLQ